MNDLSELLVVDGVYRCPFCGSKRITEISQNVLIKKADVNTSKQINPFTGKHYVSNRIKALLYDSAIIDGVGCWYYECRKCGWKSNLFAE